MNENAMIGKRNLLFIITTLILIPILLIPISKYIDGIESGNFNLTKYILYLILYIYLYRGNYIAKRITTVLTALSAITCILVFFMTISFSSLSLVLIIMALIYGFIADRLIQSNKIRAYFEYCNSNLYSKDYK